MKPEIKAAIITAGIVAGIALTSIFPILALWFLCIVVAVAGISWVYFSVLDLIKGEWPW